MVASLMAESNKTFTENGAVTYRTTGSDCLDLFGTIGALRHASQEEIQKRFLRAYTEDPTLAMKVLFYARDVRGGLGERRVFRMILNWLCANEPDCVKKNLEYIAEYGRYDDLLVLLDTPCEAMVLQYIAAQLAVDLQSMEKGENVSLLAKWLPSVNASSQDAVRQAKKIACSLGMKESVYRKTLVQLREHICLIENHLREQDYTFDYSKQPSKAMFKYRQAFVRNDGDRYREYLRCVEKGQAKLNASTLYPYELVDPYLDWCTWTKESPSFMRAITEEEKKVLNATWSSLPDYTKGENALVIVDTSGSMYDCSSPMPASVALSLGVYFAERNKGVFHNYFMEFSHSPRLIRLKGETFADRLRYAASFNQIANTNLEAVFDLILRAAVEYSVPQEEMPATLYIISDMEFDSCVQNASQSCFDNAKDRFNVAGYKLPKIVFWNVASRNRQQPVAQNEQGVALVSGCSPVIFSMMEDGMVTPYDYMMMVLGKERYQRISA